MSKPEFSLLEKFPTDIWAYLVDHLSGEQLVRLLMTGATHVWHRLMFPKVVKTIILGDELVPLKLLPRLLYDFPSLEELWIKNCNYTSNHRLGFNIASIPSGVRKLRLDGPFGEPDDLFFVDNEYLELCAILPHLEVLDLRRHNFIIYTWMTETPSTLTKLSIQRWDGAVELPSSLHHFHTIDMRLKSFASKLPPLLENFSASFSEGADLLVPFLPPSVLILTLWKSHDQSIKKVVENLPKSLTKLMLPLNLNDIDIEADAELISLMPSNLTDLQMEDVEVACSAWPHFPKNLTRVSLMLPRLGIPTLEIVDKQGEHHTVLTIPFDSLPRSLTSLVLEKSKNQQAYVFCGPPATSNNRTYFPPQLTRLCLRGIQLSPETAKLLPSSLTHLNVMGLCEQVCKHLPTGLVTLFCIPALMTPNLSKFLPKSLTDLTMSIAGSMCPCFDYNTGKSIVSILEHTEYSTHENCVSPSFDWKDSSPLPPRLTRIRITNAKELEDSFLQCQQLPNLTALSLDSKHVSDLSIPLLSPHLRSLDLRDSTNISVSSFKFLSRCLTCLNLESSESIFDSDIPHLPRTLTSIRFTSAIHLTDSCVLDLPPHLERLDLSKNVLITPSSFYHFPYSLQSPQLTDHAVFGRWSIKRGVIERRTSNVAN